MPDKQLPEVDDTEAVAALTYLKEHGASIRDDADHGNHLCQQIIAVYSMYYNHADQPTLGVLLGLVDKHKAGVDY